MNLRNLLLCTALILSHHLSAQTFELHNSINFSDVNDGRDLPDGITWFKPGALRYGIYRTNGPWTTPHYQQLKLAFETGVIIDGGSAYGKSGTILQPDGGNVGIGTVTTISPLTIKTNNSTAQGLVILNRSSDDYGNMAFYNASAATSLAGIGTAGSRFRLMCGGLGDAYERVTILNNGNVGIGTLNPSSKLTVAGNIHSREVKVTVDAGADFVFENDYNLPSLESVDKFIKENKHLPEIASADEMKKDGINLSEMNIKLLQKIEELTLYMIEQNKCIKNLKEEIEIIKSK